MEKWFEESRTQRADWANVPTPVKKDKGTSSNTSSAPGTPSAVQQ